METFGWIILILAIVTIALWIYAIADIVKGTFSGSGSKMLWLVVVIIFPIIGAFLYLIGINYNKDGYRLLYQFSFKM